MSIPLLRKHRQTHSDNKLKPEIMKWFREQKIKARVEYQLLISPKSIDISIDEFLKSCKARRVDDKEGWYRVALGNYNTSIAYSSFNECFVFDNPDHEMLFKLTWH